MGPGKREQVFDKFDGRCAYCGEIVLLDKFQVDHLKPKHLGGSHDLENLMPSCASCNNYKGVWDIEQFRDNILASLAVQRKSNARLRLLERYGIIEQRKTEVIFHFEESPDDT